jgi:hypothetical protein
MEEDEVADRSNCRHRGHAAEGEKLLTLRLTRRASFVRRVR